MLAHGCKSLVFLGGIQDGPSTLDEFAVLQDKREGMSEPHCQTDKYACPCSIARSRHVSVHQQLCCHPDNSACQCQTRPDCKTYGNVKDIVTHWHAGLSVLQGTHSCGTTNDTQASTFSLSTAALQPPDSKPCRCVLLAGIFCVRSNPCSVYTSSINVLLASLHICMCAMQTGLFADMLSYTSCICSKKWSWLLMSS